MAEGRDAGVPLKFTGSWDGKKVLEGIKKTYKQAEEEQKKVIDRMRKAANEAAQIQQDVTAKVSPSKAAAFSPAALKSIQQASDALDALDGKAHALYNELGELRGRADQLATAKRELTKQFNSGAISADDYWQSLAALERQQLAVRNRLNGLNVSIRQNINLENAAEGSLEQARIKLAQLERQIISTGGAMDGSNPKIEEMITDHARLRNEVEMLEQRMGNYKRNVGNYASGWNGLSNSINQISRELPAFTVSAQMGFLAVSNNLPILADEIQRVRVENAQLVADGKNAVPVWKQIAGALFSWQTAMSLGITLVTLYGKEIGQWIKGLFKGKNAIDELKESQNALNHATLKGRQSAQSELNNLRALYDAARDTSLSYSERRKAVEAMQKQYPGYLKNVSQEAIMAGRATTAYNALTQAILANAQAKAYNDKITENASTQLENAEKMIELQAEYNKANEEYQRILAASNSGQHDVASAQVLGTKQARDAIGRQIQELGEANGRLERQNERFRDNVSGLVRQTGMSALTGDYGKVAASMTDKQVSAYQNMLNKIADLDREYARKSMTDDEEELQALRDKFGEIRREVQKFNTDPKNKVKISLSGIDDIQKRAESDLIYRHDTVALSKELEIQRGLYQQYEDWRREFGKQSADERFANELVLIEGFKEQLKKEAYTLGGQQIASLDGDSGITGLTGAEKERLKMLLEMIRQIEEAEKKQRDDNLRRALIEYASYEQKRVRLRQQADDDMKLLDSEGQIRRETQLNEDLMELYRTEVESSEVFKEMMKTVDTAGSSVALAALKHGKKAVKNLIEGMKDATASDKAAIQKLFDEWFDQAIKGVESEDFGNVTQLVDGFGQLVDMATRFDGSMSNSLKTIGSMVNQVGQLSKTLGETLGQNLSKSGGIAGLTGAILGTVLSIAGSITEAFDRARDRRNQENEERQSLINDNQLRQTEAITKALERQLELINDLYGTQRLEKYRETLESISKNYEDTNQKLAGRLTLTSNNPFANSLIERLNNGETRKAIVKSFGAFSDEWFEAQRVFDQLDSGRLGVTVLQSLPEDITAAREELEKLQQQAELGNLDEYTINLVNQLRSQIDLYAETTNRLKAETTGTTFQAIGDEIVSMFERGNVAAKDFADNFQKIMQRSLLQALRRDVIDKELQKWYDQFDEAVKSDEELTDDEIGDLEDVYNEIIRKTAKRFEQLKQISGVDFDTDTEGSGLKSGIERMTEQTASELTGLYRSTYDTIKRWENNSTSQARSMVDLMNGSLSVLNSINNNTAATVGRLDVTVERLDVAVGHLSTIANNTKQNSTPYERGW